ncbi:MAG: hypothetical protein ABH842_00980 [Candidatus Micrarchaeota archaeon]
MSVNRLRNRLETNRKCYVPQDLAGHMSPYQSAMMPAAIAFSKVKQTFTGALTRSSGFELMRDRTKIVSNGVLDTISNLEAVALLASRCGDRGTANEIENAIMQMRGTDNYLGLRITGRELTRIHRTFARNGIAIGDGKGSVGPVINEAKTIGDTRLYAYVRYVDIGSGNMGECYSREGECEPLILLDVSRAVGLTTSVVDSIGDSHERSQRIGSEDIDRRSLIEASQNPQLVNQLRKGLIGILGGKLFYQAIMEHAHHDPDLWFVNITNAQLQTIAVHEKTHHLLDGLNFHSMMDEAFAMLSQIAYGPGTMSLAMIFGYNMDLNNEHSNAAREVVRLVLLGAGICEVKDLPKILDLTPGELKHSAGNVLDYESVRATGRVFADLVPIDEIRKAADATYITVSELPLLNSIIHKRN